jgi:hypothetical protein
VLGSTQSIYIFILYVFGIIDVDIFSYITGHGLQCLTLNKDRRQTKVRRMIE